LDEKKLAKDSIFMASDRLQVDQQRTGADQVAHLVEANGNVLLRANRDRYVKGDRATFDELKGKARIYGKPAKLYQQERPGAPYQETSADSYEYDKNTGEFKANNSRGIQVK
jgi:lipopolysaccharide export system protein LptA